MKEKEIAHGTYNIVNAPDMAHVYLAFAARGIGNLNFGYPVKLNLDSVVPDVSIILSALDASPSMEEYERFGSLGDDFVSFRGQINGNNCHLLGPHGNPVKGYLRFNRYEGYRFCEGKLIA